ncbi:hypothetical protein V8J88_04815 [Massilia sp. W12]|uniref:hypothetical protein n=1 Tax=Massilia sp. W12 TaxID=3126507 RepID=UPI0030D07F30
MRNMLCALLLCSAAILPATVHAADSVGVNYVNYHLNANQVIEIVAPAANTRGIYIRSTALTSYAGGATALFADTSAPSPPGNWKRPIFVVHGFASGNDYNSSASIYVPVGQGLYVMAQGAAGAINMSWDE